MKSVRHFVLRIIRPLAFFFLALMLLPNLQAQQGSPFSGIWEGALKVQGIELGVLFELTENAGQWTCQMDVPLQQAYDITTKAVQIEGQKIEINYPIMNARYTGNMGSNQLSIQGTWTQNGQRLPLSLSKSISAKKSQILLRPQQLKPSFSYQIEERYFENSAAKIKLGTMLTLPLV